MMRLIDADKYRIKITEYLENDDETVEILDDMPTVDAVPVVRCKDCKNSYDSVGGRACAYGVCVDCVVPDDFFCIYGERKEGAER